jgi:ABC-type spermidine/putrescine transport system permease subunit II
MLLHRPRSALFDARCANRGHAAQALRMAVSSSMFRVMPTIQLVNPNTSNATTAMMLARAREVAPLVPALAPAFLTYGMFAFLAFMDNYPVSIFFTDAWTKTLPIQIPQYMEKRPDPTIAAISTGLILLAVLALIIGDRLVALRRLADF